MRHRTAEPDSGSIEVCGIDARQHPLEVKQRIGAALQTTSLQDKITPREALALFASFYQQHAPASELLDRFGLTAKADAYFDTLSGGQRQPRAGPRLRQSAGAGVPRRADLGLDAQSRRDLHGEILRMKADGHTVLLTTHDLDEAEALAIVSPSFTRAPSSPAARRAS